MKLKEPLLIANLVSLATTFLLFASIVVSLLYTFKMAPSLGWDIFTVGLLFSTVSLCVLVWGIVLYLGLFCLNIAVTFYRFQTRKTSAQLGYAWLLFGATTMLAVPIIAFCWYCASIIVPPLRIPLLD